MLSQGLASLWAEKNPLAQPTSLGLQPPLENRASRFSGIAHCLTSLGDDWRARLELETPEDITVPPFGKRVRLPFGTFVSGVFLGMPLSVMTDCPLSHRFLWIVFLSGSDLKLS